MSKYIERTDLLRTAGVLEALKVARKAKGMTQADLGALAGIPQGHISNLEAGKVDVRLSSLVELARLLDLEIMLLPRQWVPGVTALIEQDRTSSRFLYRLTSSRRGDGAVS